MRYSQIKQALKEAEIIDEVSMSPSSLEKFAISPEAEGMLIGIEFEMCVPNASSGDDEPEWEYDWEANESAGDIGEIINFFRNGDFSNMSSREADRYSSDLWDEFSEWESNKIQEDLDEDDLNGRIRDRLEDEVSPDDYMDAAREELGDDAPDDAVQSKAVELRDEAITEIINDADSRDYQYAYDSAREEIEEEMRGSYYESDWLSDIGVDDMQDASRRWGFDWPHMYDANEGNSGDADVDTVADDFSAHTGYSARGYTGYHSGSRSAQQQEGYFIIEPDGSIDADSGDAGLEFISPAMPLKDGLEMIKKVKAWASDAGCYTNKSTGLHMNISVPDMTIENLDYVKLALFLGDEYVLQEFNRTYNSYAKSAMKVVKEKIQANPENATALLAKMKEHVNAAASKLVHSGITQKYTSINTKDKYVEFRGPGGDYLDEDIPKLLNTALRAAQALRIATDDGAYKQEYAKKLYKLVSPNEGDWTDPNNSVALFSRYALGQINKAELVNNVRQAQVARKEKKGEEQQYWVMNKDGSGGKQMVFATSETAAIIKGGSQMGMKREESISKLKAELMEKPQSDSAPDSLSQSWKDWVEDTLPNVTVDTANSVRQRIINGGDQLSAPASDWIIRQIDNELRSRMDQGVVDGRETRWKISLVRGEHAERPIDAVYVDADTPRQAKLTAQSIFSRQLGSAVEYDDLEVEAVSADEGREEQSWIVLDGFNRPVGTIQARSNDEALRIFGQINNVDTRNYTATPGAGNTTNTTSREVFDSLADVWQDWLQDVRSKSDSDLQRVIDNIAQGVNAHYTNLSLDQKDFIINTINQELRRRRAADGTAWTSSNTDLAANTGNAENAVRASLPTAHRGWLDDIDNQSDMSLINVLRNLNGNTSNLSEQQAAYFRIQVKHELRRRGISPDEATPTEQPAQAETPQDGPGLWMVGNHTYGRETFRANNRDAAIQAYAERNGIDDIEAFKAERSFVAQLTEPAQQELDLREMRRLAGLV
jgi:hypothetical protein